MYVIKSKAKNGGIWDEKKGKLVQTFKTSDTAVAETFTGKGYTVTTEKEKA